MSWRARIYRAALVLAVALFVAMAVVGGVGVHRDDQALMHAMMLLLYAEFAVVVAVFVLRGGRKKPHLR